MQHLILIGTNQQIDSSKTLAAIADEAMTDNSSLGIVSLEDNTPIDNLFHPIRFSVNTKTVIVYTNNRPFDFAEFYIYQATNVHLYKSQIRFVFLCSTNPFERTDEFTKRYKIVQLSKEDIAEAPFENLSIYRLDNKIEALLNMVETTQQSKNFSEGEKTLLCDHFKKMIMETHTKRLAYADHSTKEIINQI